MTEQELRWKFTAPEEVKAIKDRFVRMDAILEWKRERLAYLLNEPDSEYYPFTLDNIQEAIIEGELFNTFTVDGLGMIQKLITKDETLGDDLHEGVAQYWHKVVQDLLDKYN